MTRHLVVDRVLRLERERVQIDPPAWPAGLHHAGAVVVDQPEAPAELVDHGTRSHRQRAKDRAAAEPDVGEPLLAVRPNQQHHVRSRGHASSAEADPRETRIKIGLIYYEKGDFERAATEFNLVLAGDAENDRAHYYLGATYVEMKSDDKALEEFLRVPEKSELFVDARIQAAYLYDRRDQTQKAIETIQSALKKKNDQKEIFGLLASLYRKQKDYPKAIEAMERVIGLDAKNDQAHFQLGALYDENKNKEKSIANMKKAIELNPQNAAALNYLGYTWAEMGVLLDEAEILIQRALKIEPNDGFYIDSLGWVYYQKGDYHQAVELLERAVEITVDDPTIIEHLADAYQRVGKPDRALVRYREALKKSKEDEQLKRIREKMQRLERKI